MKKRITNYKSARCGLFTVLVLMISAWAQQPSANAASDTSLHNAARSGNLAVLKSRLKQGSDPDLRDKDGSTALMDAVPRDSCDRFARCSRQARTMWMC